VKARYAGRCNLCASEYPAGELLVKWVGKWVHEPCRAVSAAAAARLELPDARGKADRPQAVGVKAVRQAGISRIGQIQQKLS